MKQQPDSFFREKLEQHSMPAPINAWSRIEKEIPASKNTYFIWKVAAAILLLVVSIALLLPERLTKQEPSTLSLVTSPKQTPTQEKTNAVDIKKESAVVINETERNNKKKKQTKTVEDTASLSVLNNSEEIPSLEEVAIEQEYSITVATTVLTTETSEALHQEPVQEIVSSVSEEHNTIVIAASEANQKYLRSSSAYQATLETENTSSFRKLIDKAAAFKNNSSGLAELRQKKNEMLAVNTDKIRNRNEKTERNN